MPEALGLSAVQPTVEATPKLGKSLASRHVTMITIGGIIGAGLFVGSSASIATTGPAIIVSYGLAGLMILVVMRMLSEMAVSHPHIGAFTEFSREGLGNWAGFTSGWLYWFNWAVIAAIEAIAGARILHDFLPQFPVWVIGWALLATLTAVNMMSTRSYGEFEFWFASIKVAEILVFILLGASYVLGYSSPSGPTWANLTGHGGFMPFGPKSVLAGVITVFFSLTGAEITMIAAAESAQPSRAVAQMGNAVIGRILIFYVVSIFLIVAAVPWTLVRSGESPFALVLTQMNFAWVGLAMKVIILTAVLSCLNSAFYVCSRVMFMLAAHRDAPQALVVLNARGVPVRSVLLGTVAGLLGIFAQQLSPDRVFAFLVNASGALIVFIYMAIALSQIRLRQRRERTGGPAPPILMWGFPLLSYLAIGALLAVLAAMALTDAHEAEFWISLLTLGTAIGAYFLVSRLRSPG